MQTIRVFFEKKDVARYLSHLDLMRCFTRAVKRTRSDVWYTEGFNPHLYLMFPAPLSLGYESTYEVVDLRMGEEEDLASFILRLNEGLPLGIKALKAAPAKVSYKDVAYSRWSMAAFWGKARSAPGTDTCPSQKQKRSGAGRRYQNQYSFCICRVYWKRYSSEL